MWHVSYGWYLQFCKICLFFCFFWFLFFFFLLSGMILSFLGPYRDFLFWVRFWPEKFFRLFQSKLITLIFILLFSGFFIYFFWGGGSFSAFLGSIKLCLGLIWGPKSLLYLCSYRQINIFVRFLFPDYLIFCFLGSFWVFWGPIGLFLGLGWSPKRLVTFIFKDFLFSDFLSSGKELL